jgi:hypothetical protein
MGRMQGKYPLLQNNLPPPPPPRNMHGARQLTCASLSRGYRGWVKMYEHAGFVWYGYGYGYGSAGTGMGSSVGGMGTRHARHLPASLNIYFISSLL